MYDTEEFILLSMVVSITAIVISIKLLTWKKREKNSNINEWSYQRYAKFYGNVVLLDPNFQKKIDKIKDCILNNNITDIEQIATLSNCNIEECILKIMYLKNKRVIGDYYIDTINRMIKKCDAEDEILLDKYNKYIYASHLQIPEMAREMRNPGKKSYKDIEKDIFKDLSYLDDKKLLNGIFFDKKKKLITYYTVEKHNKALDYVTINCPNCGALVDVKKKNKARCEYCDNIVEDRNI